MARSARGSGGAVETRRPPGGYDAVVVDIEGVLTRSTPPSVARCVAADAFATVGVDDPDPSDLDALVDPDVDTVVSVAKRYGVDPDALWTRRDERAVLAREAAIRSGWGDSHEDAVALATLDCPLAVVSNLPQPVVDRTLAGHCLSSLFDATVGRATGVDGLRSTKPRPTLLCRALDELGADRPLLVATSDEDVVGARTVGIDAVRLERATGRWTGNDEPTGIRSLRALSLLIDADG
jgi:phosphoglycolate phosphatase-like HAD superfamily hydrolase